MAATLEPATEVRITTLFATPTLTGMQGLTWEEFEDFVQHVFERAGYHVTKVATKHHTQHVDLNLRLHEGGRVLAQVEVRRYRTAYIIKARVLQFLGALSAKHVPTGYLVTTSDFTQPAYLVEQEAAGKVRLLNGSRFLRYIHYISGTRLVGDNSEAAALSQPLISPDYLFQAETIARRESRQTTVLALANNKGGVAKTTTSHNVALALTEKYHQRVLLVDMDAQGSLTRQLPQPAPPAVPGRRSPKPAAWPPPPDRTHLIDYFTGHHSLAQLVRPTRVKDLWLIPSDGRLGALDLGGDRLPEKLLAFVHDLNDAALVTPDGDAFDWIILDTPTAQSFCTRAALAASHYVVVPACPEVMATRGAERGLRTAKTMSALMGSGVEVAGCLITRWKKNATSEQAHVGIVDLMRLYHSQPFATKIWDDPKIEQAHAQTAVGRLKHLFKLAPGKASKAYEEFVKELMAYVRRA